MAISLFAEHGPELFRSISLNYFQIESILHFSVIVRVTLSSTFLLPFLFYSTNDFPDLALMTAFNLFGSCEKRRGGESSYR